MSTYRLDSIFRPRAVAVVGSQSRPRSVGRAVIENLRALGLKDGDRVELLRDVFARPRKRTFV